MGKLLKFVSFSWQNPNLNEIAIVAAQHILSSTFKLFCELKKAGLDPAKTFIIGKSYSTSKKVFEEFTALGFRIHSHSNSYNSHRPFDEQYQEYIEQFVDQSLIELKKTNIKKLIVIDDGGYLIGEIYKRNFPCEIVCVEQTSAGVNYLKGLPFSLPVVNVAKSRAKLSLETPFIIESSLKRLFRHIHQDQLFDKKILIMGRGVIGECVGKFLEDYCAVTYYDIKDEHTKKLRHLVEEADFIIGCSGVCSVKYEMYSLRCKPLCLLSLSSSDREFEAHEVRKAFPIHFIPHKNYSLGNILLINGGFPINFWGTKNNMRMEKIELTMGLLLGAIYQCIMIETHSQAGFLNLDEEFERLIVSEFEKKKSKLEEDLFRLRNKLHKNRLSHSFNSL